MLYNFASSRPITVVFTHEPRYINKFLWKKKLWRPPQKKPHFLDFSKKSATRKTRFFPVGRNSDIEFWKKAQNRRFLGSLTAKIFFDKLSIRNLDTPKILVGTLRIDVLGPIFEKAFFQIFIFLISLLVSAEILWKVDFCGKWTKFGCNFPRKNMKKKMKIWKTFFRK